MKQIVEKEKLLYEGQERGYYTCSFCEEFGGSKILDFLDIDELTKKIKTNLAAKILQYINDLIEKRHEWPGKFNAHQFIINKLSNVTYLIIVAAGEKQPMLYIIYLEGVWELDEKDLV